MSWTHLNSYTLGASSSNGSIIYAYTPSSVYFSINSGVSFNEILYLSDSIPNIQTISTNDDGTKVVMGGTGTIIYDMDTSNPLNITFSNHNITGNWLCSCSSDSGINFIISENYINPYSGYDKTYTKTTSGWNYAMEGQKILSICFFKDQNNGYYNFSCDYPILYYYDVEGGYVYEYLNTGGITWSNICCSIDNTKIYVIGDSNSVKNIYYSTDSGNSFSILTSLSSSSTWSDIACSSNGAYISVSNSNDYMFISLDSGTSFTSRGGSISWLSTNISDNGNIIYASKSDGLYQSTNGGVSCFEENTFILTNEGYKKINTLKINNIIQTSEGNKKIIKIGYNYANSIHFKKSVIVNSHNPLILSNGHSILLNDLDFKKFSKTKMHPEFYKFSKKINGLNQLLVEDCILFKSIEKNYAIKYYHFVLENDDEEKQYGVYANDILCECMSEKFFNQSNLIKN